MQQFFTNRYTQLALLTLGLGTLLFLVFWLILTLIGVTDASLGMVAVGAYLGAGAFVAKFLAGRVF